MKNIPRIFIGNDIKTGDIIPANRDSVHYLTRVMRRRDFLAFGGGVEFNASISDDDKNFIIGEKTNHTDFLKDITLYFAPIKKTDDLINMATQMGVTRFQPVITEYTVASHINWERMRKIAIEASEQSNRNSVPEICPAVRFTELDLSNIIFADERTVYGKKSTSCATGNSILIGPEGGFSDSEFAALDKAGATGISLGKTILRAEVAAIIALDRIMVAKI